MSRTKKSRRITDIMPARKSDKREQSLSKLSGSKKRKLTRYELDLQGREAKKKRKHKGLASGSRNAEQLDPKLLTLQEKKDPRIGSRKKVPLMVEFVNQPEKGKVITPVALETKRKILSPEQELMQLENNECLNQFLDQLEAGKTLSTDDQRFVDECLDRIYELMEELGIEDEEESDDALLRQFETIDINKFR